MQSKSIFSLLFISLLSISSFAQSVSVIPLDGTDLADDDTLPIAPTRYDEAVELPKDNFSSVGKQDMWEKFERGELDEKAFTRLQEDYQMAASQSKDPIVKRKIASDLKEKKAEALKTKKEEAAAKLAADKKMKKKAEANKFDNEIDLMAKEKEVAQKKAIAEAKQAKAKQEKIEAKNIKRAPSSAKKKPTKKVLPKKIKRK